MPFVSGYKNIDVKKPKDCFLSVFLLVSQFRLHLNKPLSGIFFGSLQVPDHRKMKTITLCISMFLLMAAEQSVQEVSEITGRVTEKSTGVPVGDVIVRWPGTSHSTLTTADGRYVIVLQAGTRKLIFSKPGWVDKTIRVRGRRQLDLVLKRRKRIPAPLQPREDLPPDTLRIPGIIN